MSDAFENSDVELVSDEHGTLPEPFAGERPSHTIGAVLGLMGFITALLVGFVASNPGFVVITRALVAMVVCAIIGRILGRVGEVCIREFLEHYRGKHPIPEMPEALQRLYKNRADAQALKGQFSSTT